MIKVSKKCPYSLDRCKKECCEILTEYGYDVSVPISYSKGTRVLASVKLHRVSYGYIPSAISFSQAFFRLKNEDQCRQILLHEMAHFLVTAETNQNHGHDKVFKGKCRDIGCTNNKACTNFTPEYDPMYSIYCGKCGKFVAYDYFGKNKALSRKGRYVSRCCHAPFIFKDLDLEQGVEVAQPISVQKIYHKPVQLSLF